MNNFTSLIAGSTGFLGSKILNALNQEDNKIYFKSRSINNWYGLGNGEMPKHQKV